MSVTHWLSVSVINCVFDQLMTECEWLSHWVWVSVGDWSTTTRHCQCVAYSLVVYVLVCLVSVVRIGLNESQHKRLLFVQVQLPKAISGRDDWVVCSGLFLSTKRKMGIILCIVCVWCSTEILAVIDYTTYLPKEGYSHWNITALVVSVWYCSVVLNRYVPFRTKVIYGVISVCVECISWSC